MLLVVCLSAKNEIIIDDYKLIKLYEERPLLWDTRLDEYYSTTERKAGLWQEICQELGITRDAGTILVCYAFDVGLLWLNGRRWSWAIRQKKFDSIREGFRFDSTSQRTMKNVFAKHQNIERG